MEDIISSLQSVKIASYTMPRYVIVDLKYICECYINGVTDINFGDVVHDDDIVCHQSNVQFTYKDLYHHLSDLLEASGVARIDDILVHTYLEYYLEYLHSALLC